MVPAPPVACALPLNVVLMFAVAGMVPVKTNAGAAAMTKDKEVLAVSAFGVPESLTLNVTLVVPEAEAGGVPVI